jgi:hypothetical protein
VSDALATTEAARLAELEATIERGLETFVEVGLALLEIRDSRLYRATHKDFPAYVRAKWGFSGRRARQLMSAAKIGTIVPVANEAQARELAPLRKSDRRVVEAWHEAKAFAKQREVTLTAEHVRHAVTKIAVAIALSSAFLRRSSGSLDRRSG